MIAAPPTVAADTNRHSLTTDNSWPSNYVNEFFNTTSSPQGHGFNRANTGSLAACYTFLPLTNMPIKMIVLDDTCKSNALNQFPTFYGGGWVDAARLTWLTSPACSRGWRRRHAAPPHPACPAWRTHSHSHLHSLR